MACQVLPATAPASVIACSSESSTIRARLGRGRGPPQVPTCGGILRRTRADSQSPPMPPSRDRASRR